MKHLTTIDIGTQTVVFKDGVPSFTGAELPKLSTVEEAHAMADAMVRSGGNYPWGMSPCETAGINGDQVIEEHCIFDDDPECRCEELLGFPPRDECTLSDHPECLARNAPA